MSDEIPNRSTRGEITEEHVVYLNGQVDYGLERSTAESVANQVPGVTKVVNNLYVSH